MTNYAVVLTAGLGTRMSVNMPKCAHQILKKPMAKYVVDAIDNSLIDKKILVVNHESQNIFYDIFHDEVTYAIQKNQLGTGDALRSAFPYIDDLEGFTLVLPGDIPLLNYEELISFVKMHRERDFDISVLTMYINEPAAYGRIIRQNGNIVTIREKNKARDEELLIKEVNTGIYCIKNKVIKNLLPEDDGSICHLSHIIETALSKNYTVNTFVSYNESYYYDVNDYYTLSIVEKIIKTNTNKKHLLNGVNIISPETVTISSEVKIEPGVTIYPNTFITGKSIINHGAIIGPDSELHNAIVASNAIIRHSLVTDSSVGENTTVGPFAHLRNNTEVANNCRIGNFVELKNSHIGKGTKISHLTYLGDTNCGENVNWGCGCVTVNYDGKYKNKTTVGDNVFIGCNTNLIAPISVGNNVFIAAGSTITDDIPDQAFSIARVRQITKEDYATKYSYTKKNDN